MKGLLIGLTLLVTTTAIADDKSCTTVFGQRVCAEIEQIRNDVYIQNFEQDVPASKATATKLCQATGVDMRRTKVKFKTKKSADGKVLSQVRCKYKEMIYIGQFH